MSTPVVSSPEAPDAVSRTTAPTADTERWLPLVALLILALAVRWWGLQRQSFSMDEVTDLRIAGSTLSQIIWTKDGFPPLSQLILHAWLGVFRTDVAARWLSVVLGVGAVYMMFRLARDVGGQRAGIASGLVLAIAPFHVWYSQEARAYALFFLLVLSALWLFFRVMEHGRTSDAVAFTIVSIAGLYTHYYFPLVLLTTAVILMTEWRREHLRWALPVGLLLMVSALPLYWLLKVDFSVQSGGAAQAPISAGVIGYTYFAFLAGHALGPDTRTLHSSGLAEAILEALPWLVLVLVVIGTILAAGVRRLRTGPWLRRLLIIAVLPVLCCAILAVWPGVGYRIRYAMWSSIAIYLVMGVGLAQPIRRSTVFGAVAFLIIACTSLANRQYQAEYANEDLRGLKAFLDAQGNHDPVLVTPPYMTKSVRYYLGEGWRIDSLSDVRKATDVDRALGQLERAAPSHSAFWLIYSRPFHGDPDGLLKSHLLKRGYLVQRATFAGIVLYSGQSP